MRAKESRALKVGDAVIATFSGRGREKTCEIIEIAWPTFTLKTLDSKGEEMIRTRRYESLVRRADIRRDGQQGPSWLTWPDSAKADESDEAEETTPYRPSNGYEGSILVSRYCDRCLQEKDCEIISSSMFYDIGAAEYPPELVRDPGEREGRCTAFIPVD